MSMSAWCAACMGDFSSDDILSSVFPGSAMEEEQMEDSPPPRLLPSPNGITLAKVKLIQSFRFKLVLEGGAATVKFLLGDAEPSRGENYTDAAPAQAAGAS